MIQAFYSVDDNPLWSNIVFVLFQPSPFFTEQLTAFEVWLDHGSERKKPPEQLPIVLQVCLFAWSLYCGATMRHFYILAS